LHCVSEPPLLVETRSPSHLSAARRSWESLVASRSEVSRRRRRPVALRPRFAPGVLLIDGGTQPRAQHGIWPSRGQDALASRGPRPGPRLKAASESPCAHKSSAAGDTAIRRKLSRSEAHGVNHYRSGIHEPFVQLLSAGGRHVAFRLLAQELHRGIDVRPGEVGVIVLPGDEGAGVGIAQQH
jgi:hypothetical protein